MFASPWPFRRKSSRRPLAPSPRQGKPRQPARTPLRVEPLEERTLLSTMMVKDINTHTLSSSPTAMVALNGQVYFEATDSPTSGSSQGMGLYQSDGTAADTVRLDPGLTNLNGLTLFHGKLYFTALDASTHLQGLYSSDAISAPTRLASGQIVSSQSGIFSVSRDPNFPAVGGFLYFTDSAINSQTRQTIQSLYRTDGVAAPALVYSFVSSSAGSSSSSSVSDLTQSGAYLYFTISTFSPSTSTSTKALYAYKADGSAGAPTKLVDNQSGMSGLIAAGGSLYFTTGGSSSGTSSPQTLYQTTGAAAPTQVEPNLTGVGNLVSVGGYLFFTTTTTTFPQTTALYAYKADGSAGAPVKVADNLNGALSPVITLGEKAYFSVMNPATSQIQLYSSDGTAAGTGPLSGSPTGAVDLTLFNGALYFAASIGLYRTDGGAPTLVSGSLGTISALTATGGFLYVTTFTTSSSPPFTPSLSLYRTDGSSAAPTRLISGLNNSVISQPTVVPAGSSVYVYFMTSTIGSPSGTLYRSDGTPDSGIALASGLSNVLGLTPDGDNLFFSADDGQHGQEPWFATPTAAAMVKDLNTNTADSSPTGLIALNNQVYFTANDGSGTKVYHSDGTAANTVPFDPNLTNMQGMTLLNGAMYFVAQDAATHPAALYRSDGTIAGTSALSLGTSGTPTTLTALGGSLYLTTSTTNPTTFQTTQSLYKTDGTTTGTILLASGLQSINVLGQFGSDVYFYDNSFTGTAGLYRSDGTSSSPTVIGSGLRNFYGLVQVGNLIYFRASGSSTSFQEDLYRTDGTANSATKLTSGVSSILNGSFVPAGNLLYFEAVTSGGNIQGDLYRTDGTVAGTVALTSNLGVSSMTALGGKVYFVASNTSGLISTNLYVSDGTAAGTAVLDSALTNVGNLNRLGNTLYFTASDASTHQFSVYKSDGTAGGTVALSLGVVNPTRLTLIGGSVYITTTNVNLTTGQSTLSIYLTDGTAAGTIPLASGLSMSGGSSLALLGEQGGYTYFTASDFGTGQVSLYRTDGTANSATLLTSALRTTFGLTSSTGLVLAGSNLFFGANDGTHGQELWVSTDSVAPSRVTLSPTSVAENMPAGTAVGTLSVTNPAAADTFTYALVSGAGSDDNNSFTIDGVTLKTAASFDFETKSSYTVRIAASDASGVIDTEPFTISVTNVNEAPTALSLSNSTVPENSPAGTVVGTLSANDPDAGDTFTYALVAGTGDSDNSNFTISGATLETGPRFANAAKIAYSIRVRVTDSGGLSLERVFAISAIQSSPPPPVATPGSVTTVGAFDPATGTWYLKNSNSPGAPDAGHFAYGAPGWISVAGDWNGDGVMTVGVVDPRTMTWYLKNSNAPGAPDITPFRFGTPGWIPVVGDWNGDGTTTIGAVDPATMTWYLRNSNTPGTADITPFRFGAPGWVPVVGDWDGDGVTTIGVFDPIGQFGQPPATWYLKNDNHQGQPSFTPFAFGAAGWRPVVGDWDGDGVTTVGVVDPSGVWHLRASNSPGAADAGQFAYGTGAYQVFAGDWNGRDPALRVLGGEGPGGAGALDLTGLTAAWAAALQLLQNAGASAGLLAKLSAARLEIGSLPPQFLAVAHPAQNSLRFDEDAAGHGWFVDPTPLADEEFQEGGAAVPGGPADGRVDLLTAMLHELGDLAGVANGTGVMSGLLAAGSRDTRGLDTVFAGR
jgi:ELWxxDGT repeat protein